MEATPPSGLEKLETSLYTSIEALRQASITVYDYDDSSQQLTAVHDRIIDIGDGLRQAFAASKEVDPQILVPRALVEKVEQGGNPDHFVRTRVEAMLRTNQDVKGRMIAAGDFQMIFAEMLLKNFQNSHP